MIATELNSTIPVSQRGDPVWGLARLFPTQGDWSEEEYLSLPEGGIVELSDGNLEVLPVASLFHQLIVKFLARLLDDYVTSRNLGYVATAPSPIRLAPRRMREPDVFFLRRERLSSSRRPPDGADLVMEVVSDGDENRDRDLVTKRQEYAEAKIPEYWIVDPVAKTITILSLNAEASAYEVHGEFGLDGKVHSKLLPDFTVDVSATFAAGEIEC